MPRAQMHVHMDRAGNGTSAFVVAGNNPSFSRPFGAVWDGDRALWMYPAYYPVARRVIADIETLRTDVDVVLSDNVKRHLETIEEIGRRLVDRKLPKGFEYITDPYEHQVDGLCHVFYNPRSALFYEQGLGKSKIAIDLIRLLKKLGNPHRALVLGPRVTVQNWGREIDLHSGRSLAWKAVVGTRDQKRRALESAEKEAIDVVLSTYDTSRSLVDEMLALSYNLLICDESHAVRAWSSERTKSTYELAQKAARRVLMTGSPTDGNPLHLYGPYRILGDCFMPEPWHVYKKRYIEYAGHNSHVVIGYKNMDVLNGRVTYLSSRRTKAECLDLPKRTIVPVEYSLYSSQIGAYNQVVNELGIDPSTIPGLVSAIAANQTDGWRANPPLAVGLPHMATGLTKLQQISSGFLVLNDEDPGFCDTADNGSPCRYRETCVEQRIRPHTPRCEVVQTPWPTKLMHFTSNPKLDTLEDLLEGILDDPDHKCIVWCVHIPELQLIHERLNKLNIGHVLLSGDTPDTQAVVDEFNLVSTTRVLVGMSSMGVGITLNAAAYVIFNSLPYSLTQYTQCLDRNYRIGQDKAVTVYRLMGQGTIEKVVAHLLDHKIDVDRLLTSKIDCAICARCVPCSRQGIEPFQSGCIHPSKLIRPVIKAREIRKNEPEHIEGVEEDL